MNLIKRLAIAGVSAAMAIGVGVSLVNNEQKQIVARALEAGTVSYSLAFDTIGTSGWSNSYAAYDYSYSDGAMVRFEGASKQGGTITAYPVAKNKYVEFKISGSEPVYISSFTFTAMQWGTKTQTLAYKTSTDGTNFTAHTETSTDFSLSVNNLAEGTKAIRVNGTNSNNQIGFVSFEITYAASSAAKVDVTGISLDESDKTIFIGEDFTLTPTITPSDATEKGVTWLTSDNKVATVSNGVVTGVGTGDATITATAIGNTNYSATCSVHVNPIAVTGISLDKNSVELDIGGTSVITATISPSNATNTKISWTSSNDAVATVANGVITGVATGSATITATTKDGNFTATVAVTVTNSTSTKVTFVSSDDVASSDTGPLTKDGVSISTTTGRLNNTNYFQFFSGATGTFSVSSGKLVSIEFTCTASGTSNYGPSKATNFTSGSYSYSGKVGLWEAGSSYVDSVSFTLSGQMRCTTIAVTVSSGAEKTLDSLSIDGDITKSVEVGQAFDLTELTVTAHYSDSSTEDVTEHAIISSSPATATVAGNINITVSASYNDVSATDRNFTVTVTAASSTTKSTFIVADYADASGWVDQAKNTEMSDSKVSLVASGGGNTGKYYSSDETWRFYQTESATLTVTAASGYTLKTIKIVFTIKDSGALYDATSSQVTSGEVVDVSGSSYVFSIGSTDGTKGKVNITSIEVVLTDGSAPTQEHFTLNGLLADNSVLYKDYGSLSASFISDDEAAKYTVIDMTLSDESSFTISKISNNSYDWISLAEDDSETTTLTVKATNPDDSSDYISQNFTINIVYSASISSALGLATYFENICDGGLTAPDTTVWAEAAGFYELCSSDDDAAGFLALIAATEYEYDGSVCVEKAGSSRTLANMLARYDLILARYGTTNYSNFMNRTIVSLSKGSHQISTSNTTMVVIVGAMLTLTMVGGYFFSKKKKTN